MDYHGILWESMGLSKKCRYSMSNKMTYRDIINCQMIYKPGSVLSKK